MAEKTVYSLSELCELAEVTARTVRYYIGQGLLPSPDSGGPGASYGERHLHRLQLVKRLQRSHLPLSEIRSRLSALTDEEVAAALNERTEPPGDRALDYVRSVLAAKGAVAPTSMAVHVLTPSVHSPRRSAPEAAGYEPSVREQAAPAVPEGSPSTRPRPGQVPPPARSERLPSTLSSRRSRPTRSSKSGRGASSRADAPAAGPEGSSLEDEPLLARDAETALASREAPVPDAVPFTADRSSWERIALAPDIELHVRRPLSRLQNRWLARLIELARKLLQEEST